MAAGGSPQCLQDGGPWGTFRGGEKDKEKEEEKEEEEEEEQDPHTWPSHQQQHWPELLKLKRMPSMLSPRPAQTQPRTLPAEPRPWLPDPSQQAKPPRATYSPPAGWGEIREDKCEK